MRIDQVTVEALFSTFMCIAVTTKPKEGQYTRVIYDDKKSKVRGSHNVRVTRRDTVADHYVACELLEQTSHALRHLLLGETRAQSPKSDEQR